MIRQPPIQTRMADNSESTGSVPYEPTPPAFLISAREWAKYEFKVVREDGVVVDTIGTRLPMNCYLLCLCGIARRGYRPEMRITDPRLRMMRVFLRCGVSVYLVVNADNTQYFLDHRDSLLGVMRCHLELLKGRRQERGRARTQ